MKFKKTGPLTARQVEVITAYIEHGTAKKTARALGVQPSTIETHMHAARVKLKVDSALLVCIAHDRQQRPFREHA